MNHHYYKHHGSRLATAKVPLEVDSLPEIEEGLEELQSAMSGQSRAYWERVRTTLLKHSSDQDIKNAVKEWDQDGSVYVKSGGNCELCGKHPIVYHYPIKNRVTGSRLAVGSECIFQYLQVPGYGSAEDLKKKLLAERSRLLKKMKGEGDTLGAFNEAQDLSRTLLALYRPLSEGGEDFNLERYSRTLGELENRLHSAGPDAREPYKTIQSFRVGPLHRILVLAKDLGKRTRKVAVVGPMTMVQAAMNVRDDNEKVMLLKRIQELMADLLKVGDPSDFVARMVDDLEKCMRGLLTKVSEKALELESELNQITGETLQKLRPYKNLHTAYENAVEAARKRIQESADKARVEVAKALSTEIGVRIQAQLYQVSWFLDQKLKNPFDQNDRDYKTLFTRAFNLERFMGLVSNFALFRNSAAWLAQTYHLREINDQAGFRVLFFRCLDYYHETCLDQFWPDEVVKVCFQWLGMSYESPVRKMISGWAEEEIDDIRALRKKKLYQLLSENWGIDVEKVFKLFSADDRIDLRLCEGLVREWEKWPRLGPTFTAKFKLRQNEQSSPVPNNMWDYLKTSLMQEVE